MKKVFGIKEKDFFQFIRKINEFYATHDSFSTQTFKDNEYFYAVIYFQSNVPEKLKYQEQDGSSHEPPFPAPVKKEKGVTR